MESATILTPPRYSAAFRQNPSFPEDKNMKKYQHYIDARGEVLPTPHRNNDSRCDLLELGWLTACTLICVIYENGRV